MVPVSIQGLSKNYGRLRAVNNLTLDLNQGEILGFLGLNGAGKTTTIRILLDLLRPSSGRALIFGHDCQKDGIAARAGIGYLPGEFSVYAELTGREVLDLMAKLSGRAPDASRRRDLQQRLEFPDRDLNRKLREYSTGMKRKLGIIQAFQSDPLLLILDEPTEGLDPLMQESFYRLLADAKANGRTIFMSSHVLSEVGRVCDRIALMRNGELALLSSVEDMRKLAARRVRITFAADVAAPTTLPARAALIQAEPRLWILSVEGLMGPLLSFLASLPVSDVEVEEAKLESVVMKYYRGGA